MLEKQTVGTGGALMRVLVACEFSGVVRTAFRERGHDAWSCDLLPATEWSPYHIQRDVRDVLYKARWDLLIAHPPCTHLASSGARWFPAKQLEQAEALAFVRYLLDAPVDRICVENPVGVISTRVRRPDQIIQPWQFGHPESKATCLWLKGLPVASADERAKPGRQMGQPDAERTEQTGAQPGPLAAPIHDIPGHRQGDGRPVGGLR